MAVGTFVLIAIFIAPISRCLFPDDKIRSNGQDIFPQGTLPTVLAIRNGSWYFPLTSNEYYIDVSYTYNPGSTMTDAVVRAVPVVISLIAGFLMACLGPSRQMIGHSNLPETCPPLEKRMADNPIYGNSGGGGGGGRYSSPRASYRGPPAADYPDPEPRASYRGPPAGDYPEVSRSTRHTPPASERGGRGGQGPRDHDRDYDSSGRDDYYAGSRD